jgi:hypothetical protein
MARASRGRGPTEDLVEKAWQELHPLPRMVLRLRESIRGVDRVVCAPQEVASRKGREGPEHMWLRVLLHQVATEAGFTEPGVFDTQDDIPDVLLFHPELNVLLVGDAKDAWQQRARDSYGQIASYFSSTRLALRDRG